MSYELYTEYRYAGRTSAYAALIPVEEHGDELKVLRSSAGYSVQMKDRQEFIDKLEASKGTQLIKQDEPRPELVDEIVRLLEENGGYMPKERRRSELLAEAKENVGLSEDSSVYK